VNCIITTCFWWKHPIGKQERARPVDREMNSHVSEARYAVSHFGKTLLWATADVYGLYSLTEFAQISPAVAGVLFLALLTWSAVCDIVVGQLIDQHLSARATTFLMRAAAPVTGLTFALAFMSPAEAFGPSLVIGASILFRTLFSIIDVPHNGLLRQLGTTARARVRLAIIRLIAGAGSSFTVGIAAILFPSTDITVGYQILAIAIACTGAVTFLVTPAIATSSHEPNSAGAHRNWLSILKHLPLITMFLATVVGIIATSMLLKSLPYLSVESAAGAKWVARAVLAITFGKLLSTPAWYLLANRVGARRASEMAYMLYVGAALMLLVLTPDHYTMDITFALIGAAVGGASILSWTMAAELVDDLENRNTRRIQSTLFGLFTCFSKVAVGLGGLTLAAMLSLASPADRGVEMSATSGPNFMVLIGSVLVLCCTAAIVALRWPQIRPGVTQQPPPQAQNEHGP